MKSLDLPQVIPKFALQHTNVWFAAPRRNAIVRVVGSMSRDKAILVNSAVISIIDDDLATRSALAALMRAKGFRAKSYESAEDFLRSGAQDDSRCIITDIHMSGMSGIDLKERLNEGHCTVPVIMITARVEDRLHERARDVGAFCLLRKPFKAEALIACIEKALAP